MLSKLKASWKELPLKEYIYTSAAVACILLVILLILKNYLPPVVPLFYGSPAGEAQLTTSIGLLIAPIISLTIIVVNSFMGMATGSVFLKKILILGSFVFTLLMTITALKIVFLVGFF